MSRPFRVAERGTREKSVAKNPTFSTGGFLATDAAWYPWVPAGRDIIRHALEIYKSVFT